MLNKDYVNVLKDAKILEGMGIIELKKEGQEIRPISLYERIVFDLSAKLVAPNSSVRKHSALNR